MSFTIISITFFMGVNANLKQYLSDIKNKTVGCWTEPDYNYPHYDLGAPVRQADWKGCRDSAVWVANAHYWTFRFSDRLCWLKSSNRNRKAEGKDFLISGNAGCREGSTNIQEDKLYTNPLLTTNTPDPGVLALPDNAGYVLVATANHATSSSQEPAFPVYFSQDLVHWSPKGHVFPAGKWPAWAKKDMWAPEMNLVNNRFMVYFTAGEADGELHIGAALSTTDSPYGPYTDSGSPIVTEPGSLTGAIDAHYFKDPKSGDDFLLWKTDNILQLQSSLIYIRQLNKDGVSFKEDSEAAVILRADKLEEQLVAEGPWLMYRDGVYFLFYSSSWFFLANYHMRVARSEHLLGPYHKHDKPVIETDWDKFDRGENCSFVGPGHGSVVADGAGDWWLVYHGWVYGHINEKPGRLALLDKFLWKDGWPVIGIPSDTPRPAPKMG